MTPRSKHFLPRRAVQLCLLFFGVILLVAGIFQGEALMVLKKAILVCLECIGIG